ncbi:MAG: TIGR02117 family protein [Bacteroidota bacterium]
MLLLKILLYLLLVIAGILLGYALLTLIGYLVPYNRKFRPAEEGIDIYIGTNGLHTDFILPCRNHCFDWTQWIANKDFLTELSENTFLSFGWGDKAIYLDLPSWEKLTVGLTLKTLLWPTPTIMRLTAHKTLPQDKKELYPTRITEKQYKALCHYIFDTFALDQSKNVMRIPKVEGKTFTPNDNFYQSKGQYHAFNTCNTWVNKGLRRVGVRTALWSPFYSGIFYQFYKEMS